MTISQAGFIVHIFADWAFLPNATAFARLSAEHLNSRNDFYTYTAPEVTFGAIVRLRGVSWFRR